MNGSASRVVVLAWLEIILVGCGNPGVRYFSVALEQGGRRIEIRDHQARLERKPFAILLELAGPDEVLVNASFEPYSFEAARNGRPLSGIVGFTGPQLDEPSFNPYRLIHLDNEAFHCWDYRGRDQHKFDEVRFSGGGGISCRRIVVGYVEPSNPAPRSLRYISGRPIYLVFAKTVWNPAGTMRIAKQIEYLKLTFE